MTMKKTKADIEEAAKKVLADISDGHSARESCEKNGITRRDFNDWTAESKAHMDHYAHARRQGADAQFEEMQDIERRVFAGELDPQAARVALDCRKWRLARMRPNVYGEKQQVDVRAAVIQATPEQVKAVLDAFDQRDAMP